MMFRKHGISNIDNAQQFYIWLKLKGITSHANNIVEAVAEKVHRYVDSLTYVFGRCSIRFCDNLVIIFF
jgi:hypothetical protein